VSIPMTDSLKQRLIESDAAAPTQSSAQPYPFVPADWGRMGVLRTTSRGSQSAPGHPGALHREAPASPPQPLEYPGLQQSYRHPGEAWQGETARIAAALEEAQAAQRSAGWGANRDPRFPAQPSPHFERTRSPVSAGAAATPIPGPARWQPSTPSAFPQGY
jgi:hypothetical protein